MTRRNLLLVGFLLVLAAAASWWFARGRGGSSDKEILSSAEITSLKARLKADGQVALPPGGAATTGADAGLARWSRASERAAPGGSVVVDYPLEDTVFPPEIVPPTLLWHDESDADVWLVRVETGSGADVETSEVLVKGAAPVQDPIDPEALGEKNEIYRPTPYQASAHAWTPPAELWSHWKSRSTQAPARVRITGLSWDEPAVARSAGSVRFTTSKDPVGAPIFYRDVPLMPAVSESLGVIQPLSADAIHIIKWRLRDIGRPQSKVVLQRMTTCANCHSFSRDGKTLAMDVDGPTGDKGAYAVAPIQKDMSIESKDVLTWNSFPGRKEGQKTIGFLSRISPDGQYVVSTVNEALYVANFADYRTLQVFYPTRGILAVWSRATGEIHALPGADDPAYVHCAADWTPDGKSLVFCRARARDPYEKGLPRARYPNDPLEPLVQYDLCRIPFNQGRGGTPEPIAGASDNGMSNTFPKVSPDGKWIVFTRCRNGLLLRPDGRLFIVPLEGGEARKMRCNTNSMNSWHSFSPNGRWLVFTSKVNTPYTQMFLTHIDDEGNDTPAVLIPHSTASNRAVNLPEFMNAPYESLDRIQVPAVHQYAFVSDAIDLAAKGHVKEAIGLLDRTLAADANVLAARTLRAHLKARLGDLDGALQDAQSALKWKPDDPYAFHAIGVVRRAQGRLDDAARAFQTAVRVFPDYLVARRDLATVLFQTGHLPGALDQYREVARSDPRDTEAVQQVGRILQTLGHAEEAVTWWNGRVEQDASDVPSRLALAWVLATTEDKDLRDGPRAVSLAEEAVKLTAEKDPAPYDVLGAALAAGGRFEDAAEAARHALDLTTPASPPAFVSEVRERLADYENHHPAPTR